MNTTSNIRFVGAKYSTDPVTKNPVRKITAVDENGGISVLRSESVESFNDLTDAISVDGFKQLFGVSD